MLSLDEIIAQSHEWSCKWRETPELKNRFRKRPFLNRNPFSLKPDKLNKCILWTLLDSITSLKWMKSLQRSLFKGSITQLWFFLKSISSLVRYPRCFTVNQLYNQHFLTNCTAEVGQAVCSDSLSKIKEIRILMSLLFQLSSL